MNQPTMQAEAAERSASTPPAAPVPSVSSPFVPLLLTVLAVAGWFAFQATHLMMERQQLAKAKSASETQQANATKVRASLDAVATATAKLATDGNSNARVIVDELRKRGITINTAASAATDK